MLSEVARDLSAEAAYNVIERSFTEARTHFEWRPIGVDDIALRSAYSIAKFGPTASNSSPMRLVFVKSKEGKERLKAALFPGNVDKTMAAPVTAIVGYDINFHEHLPKLFPHNSEPQKFFTSNPDIAARAAFRNSTLQGAYLLVALRMVGLDCGPMSGFKHDVVDSEFFPNSSVKSNFLINIGHGDGAKLFPRGPRFEFDEIARFV